MHAQVPVILRGRCRIHTGWRRFSGAACAYSSAAPPRRARARTAAEGRPRTWVLRRIQSGSGILQTRFRGEFLKMYMHNYYAHNVMRSSVIWRLHYDAALTISICSRLIHDVNEPTANRFMGAISHIIPSLITCRSARALRNKKMTYKARYTPVGTM